MQQPTTVLRGSMVYTATPRMSAPGSNPGKDTSLIGGHGFEYIKTRFRFWSFGPNAPIVRTVKCILTGIKW